MSYSPTTLHPPPDPLPQMTSFNKSRSQKRHGPGYRLPTGNPPSPPAPLQRYNPLSVWCVRCTRDGLVSPGVNQGARKGTYLPKQGLAQPHFLTQQTKVCGCARARRACVRVGGGRLVREMCFCLGLPVSPQGPEGPLRREQGGGDYGGRGVEVCIRWCMRPYVRAYVRACVCLYECLFSCERRRVAQFLLFAA